MSSECSLIRWGPKLGKRTNRSQREASWAFVAFTAPLIIGLAVFMVIPIVWGFIVSLFDAKFTFDLKTSVGLENYVRLLSDPQFTGSLKFISIFTLFIVPTTYAFSLGLALLVNSVNRGKSFFRSVFFIPTACSYVLASMIWRMGLFNDLYFGLVNTVIKFFGIPPINWTTSLPWVWVTLVTVRLWLQCGFYMILFIGALQEIPQELYDAAGVDGAERGWVTFWYITFPLLRNISVFILLLNIIHAFRAFDEFYNILGGTYATMQSGAATLRLARPPMVYLYTGPFSARDYGIGMAGSFIITFLIVIIALVQGRILGFGRSIRA